MDAAVVAKPDEKWGETIKAIIATKGGENISEEEVAQYLKTKLSGFKRPRIFQFVPQLPKIGSGKLDRTQIKRTYGQK